MEKSDSTRIDAHSVWPQLREIQKTILLRRLDGLGPRAVFALFIAVTVLLLSMGVLLTIVVSGFEISKDSFYGYPISAALVTYFVVMLRSRRPKTWTALLNQQLTAYTPIDREAHLRLQQQTMDLKYIDVENLNNWLRSEYRAVDRCANVNRNSH